MIEKNWTTSNGQTKTVKPEDRQDHDQQKETKDQHIDTKHCTKMNA